MKVRIDACFWDGDNSVWREPYGEVEVKDSLAQDWIDRGWAISVEKPVEKPLEKPAAIETPEDEAPVTRRERATLRRKAEEPQ